MILKGFLFLKGYTLGHLLYVKIIRIDWFFYIQFFCKSKQESVIFRIILVFQWYLGDMKTQVKYR